MIKNIIALAGLFLLTACSSPVRENKAVYVDFYIYHSQLKSYENFSLNDPKDYPNNYSINDVVKKFPVGSHVSLVSQKTKETIWNMPIHVVEKNNMNIRQYTQETLNKIDKNSDLSSFELVFTPLFNKDNSSYVDLKYTINLLKSHQYNEATKSYEAVYETIKESKNIEVKPNKFYIEASLPLEDKTSLIILYKLRN